MGCLLIKLCFLIHTYSHPYVFDSFREHSPIPRVPTSNNLSVCVRVLKDTQSMYVYK